MILEVGMTMFLYFVSCTRKIDLSASDLDLLKVIFELYICLCNEKMYSVI